MQLHRFIYNYKIYIIVLSLIINTIDFHRIIKHMAAWSVFGG